MGIKIGQAKEIEMEEAIAFLREHDHFLLAGHEHPDGDDVGSLCALYNVLVSMGKTADMILPDPVPSAFTLVKSSAKVLMEIPEVGKYDAMVLRIWRIFPVAEILIFPMCQVYVLTIIRQMKSILTIYI